MGLETEVGELMDQLKKHIFYGKELDLVNLSEELGDLNWYQAICIDALSNLLNVNNTDLEESIKSTNISKLSARYPNLFTGEDAINRNTNKERQILENNG
jgi:NTP pyrophosphatase (non-canonical NTP hydrolase)